MNETLSVLNSKLSSNPSWCGLENGFAHSISYGTKDGITSANKHSFWIRKINNDFKLKNAQVLQHFFFRYVYIVTSYNSVFCQVFNTIISTQMTNLYNFFLCEWIWYAVGAGFYHQQIYVGRCVCVRICAYVRCKWVSFISPFPCQWISMLLLTHLQVIISPFLARSFMIHRLSLYFILLKILQTFWFIYNPKILRTFEGFHSAWIKPQNIVEKINKFWRKTKTLAENSPVFGA